MAAKGGGGAAAMTTRTAATVVTVVTEVTEGRAKPVPARAVQEVTAKIFRGDGGMRLQRRTTETESWLSRDHDENKIVSDL